MKKLIKKILRKYIQEILAEGIETPINVYNNYISASDILETGKKNNYR